MRIGKRRKRFRITLQYLGTRYHGWQIQRNRRTVQGTLKKVLTELAGETITIIGASRTDSGVHAKGQVAHFVFPEKASIPDLKKTLNALLPWDIRVMRLQKVKGDFHAQRSANKKLYEYRIFSGDVLPPFLNNQATHVPRPLDVGKMAAAASQLVGTYDFSGFAASSTSVVNHVRSVYRSEVTKKGCTILYRVEANGFLHHMVRNIVGTLLEIGIGRRAESEIHEILKSKDRDQAGATAPPQGLYLVRIWY